MHPLPSAPSLVAAFALLAAALAPSGLAAVEYEKDIMPIFMAKCAECHSDKEGNVKGGLKFDDPAHFHRRFDRNSVVVPGDWDASYLFVTLFRPADDKAAMPPKGKGERLTRSEVELVMRWIAEGAAINRARGARGEMPENIESLLADLPAHTRDGILGAMTEEPGGSAPGAEAAAPPTEEDWSNAEGRTLRAALLGVELGESGEPLALLRTADGTVHRYPVSQLSGESRERAMERGGGAMAPAQ